MNPYLKGPGRSPLDPQHNIDRQMNNSPEYRKQVRGFSPDYEPDKTATIRAVTPRSRDAGDVISATYVSIRGASASRLSSGMPLDVDGPSGEERDSTFLQDSSENDPDEYGKTSTSPLPKDAAGISQPFTSEPLSLSAVSRHMALVAEYERVHSRRSPTSAKSDLIKTSTLESPRTTTDYNSPQIKSSNNPNQERAMLTPSKPETQVDEDHLVSPKPSSSEEGITFPNVAVPETVIDPPARTSGSTDTMYKSATSLPIVQIDYDGGSENSGRRMMIANEATQSLDGTSRNDTVPTEDDRERAKEIYEGSEGFVQKEKAAAWMGEEGPSRARTLDAYMELYDFSNLNILAALRNMCSRLILKAESQQVDRILDGFAKRWCQCNPNHGFKATGKTSKVISYSQASDMSQMLFIQYATQSCY
jgi:hypothetical protein